MRVTVAMPRAAVAATQGLVLVDAESVAAYAIQPSSEEVAQRMKINEAWRHLRAYPELVGVLKLGGPRFALVQAKSRLDERKEPLLGLQEKLAMAVLKTKASDEHVGFW